MYITSQLTHTPVHGRKQMLEHLVQIEPEITDPGGFTALAKADVGDILSAQVKTADWLAELGATPDAELIDGLEKTAARQAFSALAMSPAENSPEQRAHLAALKTPEAVRHLTGMLSAYDWEFIEQAKQIRGFAVAQLVEDAKHSNPNIRLKALGLLGKVTEIGLFTEKIEVKKTEYTDAELEQRIKEKLNRFMGVVDVIDAKDVLDVEDTPDVYKKAEKVDTSGATCTENGEKQPSDHDRINDAFAQKLQKLTENLPLDDE